MPLLPAIALCLGLLGACSDSSDSTTTNNTTITPDSSPEFDHTSMRTQDSVWQLPQSRLNLHEEARTSATIIGAAVAINTAPYGMLRGGIGNSTTTTQVYGFIANQPVPASNPPGVLQETMGFLGAASQLRYVAKAIDGTLFTLPYSVSSQVHLPATSNPGTTWRSDMDMSAGVVGKAFVYAPIGQIYYRPTIRTIAAALQPGDDAEVMSRRRAVTTAGTPTDDLSVAAIDYSTAEAYRGAWLDVRRIGSFVVVARNVTSPRIGESGCVQVRLRLTYQLVGERPVGLDQTLGLDLYQGGYDMYWKPGVGWIEWNGSETTPSFGTTYVPSTVEPYGAYPLSQYNYHHDHSMLGVDVGTNFPYALPYSTVFSEGYYAAYQDESPPDGYYSPAPRKNLIDALATYRSNNGCSDIALLSDSGSGRGRLAVIEAAFANGYALGAMRYSEDYNAIADAYDALKSGREQRSSVQMSFNAVPDAFRPSNVYRIGADLAPTVMADAWPTGRSYPNGYDGMGLIVDAWDGSVDSGAQAVRRQVDPAGVEIRRVYIALPILGYTRTNSFSGNVTDSGVVSASGG